MANIILSYRRADSGAITGRVFDRLVARYGRDAIFRDIDSIPVGTDFRAHIADAIGKCDVLLAMIGPKWLGRSAKGAATKIQNEDDAVRIEIEAALRIGKSIIPVLVANVKMPNASQLPPSLGGFVFRNGIRIDPGQDFEHHMERLVREIDRIVEPKRQSSKQPHEPVDEGDSELSAARTALASQEIRYCRAPDGVRLAYAKSGKGPPLVRSTHWLGHLECDWELPIFRHWLLGIGREFTLIRYDARGNGLSDRDVADISLEAWVSDLKTVVDAAGLEKFPLLGVSQGCPISIAFAVRFPERVSHLVLYGGYAVGRLKRSNISDADRERIAAMTTLMRLGWGADNPTFRQLFTSSLIPTATKEEADAFNETQLKSASPECAVRYYETVNNIDVRPLLSQVRAPTLVMHVRDDLQVPIELGRDMAAAIPDARFVTLPGKNHPLLGRDPGLPRFLEEMRNFLKPS
jgi:pimeloyl-ACP methyl ester carboxylesterase